MAFFKFKSQNKDQASKSDETEVRAAPLVQLPSSPVLERKEMPRQQTPATKKKKEKESIGDFFTIDIYNIFRYEVKQVTDYPYLYRMPVEVYSFKPRDLELSTFFRVDVVKFESGNYDLIFRSNINEIREDLKTFVDFCITYLGPDFMNKGSIDEKDVRDASLGVFSRIWYNKMRIENLDFTITLTINDITPHKSN